MIEIEVWHIYWVLTGMGIAFAYIGGSVLGTLDIIRKRQDWADASHAESQKEIREKLRRIEQKVSEKRFE